MNQVEEIEKDFELIHGPGMSSCSKVTVAKKTLTFYPNNRAMHPSWGERNERIIFSKSSNHGQKLYIEVRWNDIKTQQCSLGHHHELSKKEREYKSFSIAWEHVEQLAEWLNSGSWKDLQGDKAPINRIAKQAIELIEAMEKHGDFKFMKGAIKKVKTELAREVGL